MLLSSCHKAPGVCSSSRPGAVASAVGWLAELGRAPALPGDGRLGAVLAPATEDLAKTAGAARELALAASASAGVVSRLPLFEGGGPVAGVLSETASPPSQWATCLFQYFST